MLCCVSRFERSDRRFNVSHLVRVRRRCLRPLEARCSAPDVIDQLLNRLSPTLRPHQVFAAGFQQRAGVFVESGLQHLQQRDSFWLARNAGQAFKMLLRQWHTVYCATFLQSNQVVFYQNLHNHLDQLPAALIFLIKRLPR